MNDEPISVPALVPVFPLPGAVLFPRQVLPLHIFEPRYRTMVADALAGEQRIAVALLKPNYESYYFTAHAPIHRLVGIGRIMASQKLKGGKYNILLRGEARARLIEELPGRPYRFARIRKLEPHCTASASTRAELRGRLWGAVRAHLARPGDGDEQYARLFEAPLSLGELTDAIAGGLPITGELRQCLLAELETCTRAKMLLQQIRTLGSVARHKHSATCRTEWSLN